MNSGKRLACLTDYQRIAINFRRFIIPGKVRFGRSSSSVKSLVIHPFLGLSNNLLDLCRLQPWSGFPKSGVWLIRR